MRTHQSTKDQTESHIKSFCVELLNQKRENRRKEILKQGRAKQGHGTKDAFPLFKAAFQEDALPLQADNLPIIDFSEFIGGSKVS